MKNAQFEQFGGTFEVVWHNINSIKTSVYCEEVEILYKAMNETTH